MKTLDKEKLEYNIEQIARYDLDNNNVFGSSYFVSQKDETVFKKHFGRTGPDASGEVNDNTIYRLASMTKPITAVAILVLLDRGLISLDDPVYKFIPEIKNISVITGNGEDLGKSKTDVTILHCLTHTSGFGGDKDVVMSDEDKKTISNTINRFVIAGLDFEPFTKQCYSSVAAFDVLASIVEKVTGQEYEDFLKNEIFAPCNMPDTTFCPTADQWDRVIAMHNKAEQKSEVAITYPGCVFEKFPCEHNLAGAGLVSTLNDYANFAKMLLNKGNVCGKQIASPETMCKISKIYLPEKLNWNYGQESWGFGVRVIIHENYKTLPVGSFGWSGAYGSHFWVDPENEICAVFMKNSKFDGGSGNSSALRFEEAVLDALK